MPRARPTAFAAMSPRRHSTALSFSAACQYPGKSTLRKRLTMMAEASPAPSLSPNRTGSGLRAQERAR